MNETLEAMARAIFKSWFVDFDPVRANAEGRGPYGMDADTAALFPDSFQDSELGKIPKGWEALPLGNVCEFAYGKALRQSDRKPGRIPVYGSNGQVGWHDAALVKGPGIVVGRKGNPGIVTWVSSDFFPIDTTFYVIPRPSCMSFHYLLHALAWLELASLGSDSAVPGLNRNMAYMSSLLLPPGAVSAAFDRLVAALTLKRDQNELESRTLAALRDALLPKLLSGEIRIKDAEQLVEAEA